MMDIMVFEPNMFFYKSFSIFNDGLIFTIPEIRIFGSGMTNLNTFFNKDMHVKDYNRHFAKKYIGNISINKWVIPKIKKISLRNDLRRSFVVQNLQNLQEWF